MLTKAPEIGEHFQTAVFRFTDDTAAEILKASAGETVGDFIVASISVEHACNSSRETHNANEECVKERLHVSPKRPKRTTCQINSAIHYLFIWLDIRDRCRDSETDQSSANHRNDKAK